MGEGGKIIGNFTDQLPLESLVVAGKPVTCCLLSFKRGKGKRNYRIGGLGAAVKLGAAL